MFDNRLTLISEDTFMDWKSYEEVTKHIYETLGKDARVSVICFGSTCKVLGKSGVKHQVDVLTSHSDGIHIYKTAIECKFWDTKVQKDSVTKLAEILEDAKIDKGVIVSKSGFTPDAIDFAQYKNISLVELREPTDEDWQGRIKDILIDIIMPIPHVEDFKFVQLDSIEDEKEHFSGLSSDIIVVKPDGSQETIQQLIERKMANSDWHQNDYSHHEEIYPEGSYIKILGSDKQIEVIGSKFTIRRTEIKQKVEIRGEDYVSMIMQNLFDDTRFILSRDGKINKAG